MNKNVIDAICHQINEDELNKYIIIILERTKIASYNDKEVVSIVNDQILKNINNLNIQIKKLMFFHILNIDNWMKNWVYLNNNNNNKINHQYESLPKEIGNPFFLELFKLCEENIEFRIEDDEFLLKIKKLYNKISNDYYDNNNNNHKIKKRKI